MSEVEFGQLISPEKIPSPQTDDRQYRRLGVIVLGLLVGIFGIWGALAPLSSAISASGKVSVASYNRMIQHLEGGIVKTILVKDGDNVKIGDLLLKLDDTQAKAQLDVILAQYYENLALEARLMAERDGTATVMFGSAMDTMQNANARTMIMEAQRRQFTARAQQLVDDKRILSERIEQLRNQVQGLESLVSTKTFLSHSYNEEIKELEILYAQQLIDKLKLRDIKREKASADGDIAHSKSEIARAKAQMSEIKAQMIAQKQTFVKDVLAELHDVQAKLADSRARIDALKDVLSRTSITAPVSGIIANSQIHTVGGVVSPGRPILEIVPAGEPLIIEAKVAASDIANVHVGLKAEIRFPGFAHIKSLNVVMGEVTDIAPDSISDESTKMLYYPIKIRVTAEGQAELVKNHLTIQPGNPAEAMVVTASSTFLEYMVHPFKYMIARAFNEQ